MIVGIGIDIIEIPRVKELHREYGDSLVEKIFTEGEIAYCRNKAFPERSFAARFSAKEAFLKALGHGLTGGIGWKDIEVSKNENGKPEIILSGKAQEAVAKYGDVKINLSVSHTDSFASAIVVIETIEKNYR